MYTTVKGKNVNLYNGNGQIVRRLSPGREVCDAQVNGDQVVVRDAKGFTTVYNSYGQIVRRTKG